MAIRGLREPAGIGQNPTSLGLAQTGLQSRVQKQW